MRTAEIFAELSYARRLHVGAIVVKDDRIISIGYNGMPSGWDNNCENRVYANEWTIDNAHWDYQEEDGTVYNLKSKPEVLHAEMNALMKLAKSNESGDGASIFITHAPCMDCAKGVYQAGIRNVYYRDSYRETTGIDFLKKCGVIVEQVNMNEEVN